MRARETCIHAVDLGAGTAFDDLPHGFLSALIDDVVAWRSVRSGSAIVLRTPEVERTIDGAGDATPVNLPLATAAAWLVGRHRAPHLPTLPDWI